MWAARLAGLPAAAMALVVVGGGDGLLGLVRGRVGRRSRMGRAWVDGRRYGGQGAASEARKNSE